MQSKPRADEVDIAVVGGGITGLLAACALSTTPHRVACIAPDERRQDGRTTALLADAIADLRALDAWDACEPHAAPLRTMRLLDGTSRLLRSRPLDFNAGEIGLTAFGYNVPNEALLVALRRSSERAGVVHRAAHVAGVDATTGRLTLSDGSVLHARLLVAADGRNSMLRAAAGIRTRSWTYDQVAFVLTFRHDEPHAGVSTELHTESGPFTQVPLPAEADAPHRSSLVWVVRTDEAGEIEGLSTSEMERVIEKRFERAWGAVAIEREPQRFPLAGQVAVAMGRDRTALVGEAGHVFPPIGAQGANLGFRDVRDLVRLLRSHGPDVVAAPYSRARAGDVGLRTAGVDLLNRSLLTDLLPVQVGRFAATEAIVRSGPLRRAMMRSGLAPSSARQGEGNGSAGRTPAVMT